MGRLGTVALAALGAVAMLPAQSSQDSLVTTWATAQQLIAPTGPPLPARQKGPEASNLPAPLADRWIRAKGNFDAVVDLDAVLRDAQSPARLNAEADSGDHIHPNDAGNLKMANPFELGVFKQ
jgi:hypothetical protein